MENPQAALNWQNLRASWRVLSRLPVQSLMALVRFYRFFLSPWLGSACRFEPTCSAYSLSALEKHGALAGSYMTLHRLVRCGPWCPGGHDPVPEHAPRLFTGLPTSSPDKTQP